MKFVVLLASILSVGATAQTTAFEGHVRGVTGKDNGRRQIIIERDVNHVFPYILSSAAWTTSIHITNLEDHDIQVVCEFVGPNGEEKPLTFDFDDQTPTAGTSSKISSLSTASFKSVSADTALTTAWAYCSAEPRTERFSGYAIVRNTTSTGAAREFVTPLQPESETVFSVPFLAAADNTTGLVVLNNALEGDASLGIWMIDTNGKQVDTRTLTLKPGALRIIVLNDVFKDVKEGTVRVVKVEGTPYVSAMALKTSVAGYTALPVLAPKEDPPPAQ